MSNREREYRFDANAPNINRPLAFPELARGRTFAQPCNIKVKPLRPRRQGIESYNRAQMALLGLGVFAAVSAVLITLRIAVWLPGLE
jgi:hypothetical protein